MFYTFRDSVGESDTEGIYTPQSFYTGNESNPQFLPGTYQAEFTHLDYTIYDGSLTVTDLTSTSTVTPEPSTLALLGTGLLGVAALRRRLQAGEGRG